jgi:hypothetical protein
MASGNGVPGGIIVNFQRSSETAAADLAADGGAGARGG